MEGDFLTCMQLTGSNPKIVADYSFTRPDSNHFDNRCQNGMNVRYLTIYRKAQWGDDLDVFVADLDSNNILSFFKLKGSIDFSNHPIEQTTVTVRQNATKDEREKAKSEALRGDVRRATLRPYSEYQKEMAQNLMKTFNQQTGGEIGNLSGF